MVPAPAVQSSETSTPLPPVISMMRASGSSFCTSITWSAPSFLATVEPRAVLRCAGDDDQRGAGLLADHGLRQALLAGALDQHGRIVADAAVEQRPFDAVRHRRDEPGEFRRDALRHVVHDRVPRQVDVLREAAPQMRRLLRPRCSRSGWRRGWCASWCSRNGGTGRRGTTRTCRSTRSARRKRDRLP